MITVVDTSIAINWFVYQENSNNSSGADISERALKVLHSIYSNPQDYAVPELFYFEFTHVIKKLIKKPNSEQTKLIKSIFNLGWNRFSMTESFYLEVKYFQEVGLSGYDASYVALAKVLKGKWLTCDVKAHRLVERFGVSRVM